ncbi:VOC family protein [Sphingomonas sp.]|uniref:VOC family protein n=1 Tax=Sphingomonas sp. TaxID=28214 RepID=UPI0017C5D208|nr:VOC family protein [Sphingomonas sp.]MBA3510812.1 VOC family protein [Sphingomonas sp.]
MDRNPAQEPGTGLTPHLTIRDRRAAEAIEFYTAAFGAEELMRMPSDDGRLMHAHLKINGSSLMMHDDFPEHGGGPAGEPAGVMLHLQVDDADGWWNRAVDAGAEVTLELADQFWGDRYGQLRDPFGHRWSIGAPIRRQ